MIDSLDPSPQGHRMDLISSLPLSILHIITSELQEDYSCEGCSGLSDFRLSSKVVASSCNSGLIHLECKVQDIPDNIATTRTYTGLKCLVLTTDEYNREESHGDPWDSDFEEYIMSIVAPTDTVIIHPDPPTVSTIYPLNETALGLREIILQGNRKHQFICDTVTSILSPFRFLTSLSLINIQQVSADSTTMNDNIVFPDNCMELLEYLHVQSSPSITMIDLSRLARLKTAEVTQMENLVNITWPASGQLQNLRFDCNNMVRTLDLSGSMTLKCVNAHHNKTLATINMSGCVLLNSLVCELNHELEEMLLRGCIALSKLVCTFSPQLATINTSDCRSLGDIMLSHLYALRWFPMQDSHRLQKLHIAHTGMLSWNLTGQSSLESVCLISNRQLMTLEVSNCNALRFLSIHTNSNITTINASHNPSLTTLYVCGETSLTNINISRTTRLQAVLLNNNRSLSEINLGEQKSLISLDCTGLPTLRLMDLSQSASLTRVTMDECSALQCLTLAGAECGERTIKVGTSCLIEYAN